MDWLLFFILFGVVVFIHELGHFSVAKLSGVRVERFAIGFGPAVLKKTWGETEYAICLLPLGGYVKMEGEEFSDEDREKAKTDPGSYAGKGVGVRIAIVSMGPIFNLLLPIALFMILFMAGAPTIKAKIGTILPGSPAASSELRPGDQILAIDQVPIWKWSEMEKIVRANPGKALAIKILRSGEEKALSVTPQQKEIPNVFGEMEAVGQLGITPQPTRPAVGIRNSKGVAAQQGVQTGDVLVAINGSKVEYWWQIQEMLPLAKSPLTLEFERLSFETGDKVKNLSIESKSRASTLADLGLEKSELYIAEVVAGSIAKEVGIQGGDRLFELNGETIKDWYAFQESILANDGEEIKLALLREGKKLSFDLTPRETERRDELTREKETRRQIGIKSALIGGPIDLGKEQYLNPFTAFFKGIGKTIEMSVLTVTGLTKLITGQLNVKKSLGGPISIFFLAGDSYKRGGWLNFFQMMAMLSITLGIINLLPIPVLDGGHLFFFVIEAVKGSPVSLKLREISQQVGFVILLGLIFLTIYVDVNRYFMDRIRAFFQ